MNIPLISTFELLWKFSLYTVLWHYFVFPYMDSFTYSVYLCFFFFFPPSHVLLLLLSCFSLVQLFATLWTIAHQAPLSTGFSRQEYWSGMPCPSLGDPPHPGTESTSLPFPALAGGFFTTSSTLEALIHVQYNTLFFPFELFSWCPMNLILLKN